MFETHDQQVASATGRKRKVKSQAERTAETRALLIQAAEKIFARDGFQAAKLDDIAAEAGYTRGAFYANFQDKEELFIALMAHEAERRLARGREFAATLNSHGLSKKDRYRALKAGYLKFMLNPTWNILAVEFKLFVLRHPELKPKVREMQSKAFEAISVSFEQMFARVGSKPSVSPLAAGMALNSLTAILGIDLIISEALKEQDVNDVISRFLDALTGLPFVEPKRLSELISEH